MKGKILTYVFAFLLVADISYSFVQHYYMFLDGDLVFVSLPSDGCKRVLEDPFGFAALKGEHYVNPNRFFAHATMYVYFNSVPFAFQLVTTPVESLYLSAALAKTTIQVFLIWLLSVYITGSMKIKKKNFIISALLVTPLFQTWGYYQSLGIIDQAVSYAFFYALPLALLMLFFLPFYLSYVSKQPLKIKPLQGIFLVILAIVIAFNGPLPSPVAIIVCTLFLSYTWWKLYKESLEEGFIKKMMDAMKRFPKQTLFFFSFMSLLAVYSFYIGTFNSAFVDDAVPLADRYLLLPKGLYKQIIAPFGCKLLLLLIGVNCTILFTKRELSEAKSLLIRFKWILIFSIIYVLMMPLGGYREYRPFIIRFDTFMPVNLCLIYFYGISTLFIITHYVSKFKIGYYAALIAFLVLFTWVDKLNVTVNKCEKEALYTIANSKEKVVFIESGCNIMSWGRITHEYHSRYNTRYLRRIGVINEEKYYYQK